MKPKKNTKEMDDLLRIDEGARFDLLPYLRSVETDALDGILPRRRSFAILSRATPPMLVHRFEVDPPRPSASAFNALMQERMSASNYGASARAVRGMTLDFGLRDPVISGYLDKLPSYLRTAEMVSSFLQPGTPAHLRW